MLLNWAIPEKIQTGCWVYTILKKSPEIFRFVTLLMEIPDKMKFHPWKFHQIVLTHWSFQGQKPRPMGISHYFFLDYVWKFHFFFIDF